MDRSAYAAVSDDVFFSPTEATHPPISYSFTGEPDPPYGVPRSTYRTGLMGQSSASLISRDSESIKDDDEAGLTSNVSNTAGWEGDMSHDAERIGGIPPRRRTTLRYSATPSPLKRTETAIRNMSRGFRRVSLRVVNIGGNPMEDSVRLPDGDEDDMAGEEEKEEEQLPDLRKEMPIRGRTLGIFGPQSRVRLALYNFLVHP